METWEYAANGRSTHQNRGQLGCRYMGVSYNGGTQQPLVFLLKMIILRCFGGTKETPIYIYILLHTYIRKYPTHTVDERNPASQFY